MSRDVTLFNVSCNLSRNSDPRAMFGWVETGKYFQIASFYWLPNKNIARQVARVMLHCAMFKKCVAALRQSLRKVEPDSTSCNTCCNKNVA